MQINFPLFFCDLRVLARGGLTFKRTKMAYGILSVNMPIKQKLYNKELDRIWLFTRPCTNNLVVEDSAAGAMDEQQSLQALERIESFGEDCFKSGKRELVTLVQGTIPAALQRNHEPA